jgi:Pro-kumamolisin, activation domain
MSRLSSAAPQRRALSFLTLAIFLSLLSADLPAEAQPAPVPPNLPLTQPPFVQVKDRITSFIDEDQRVTLRGNVHPLALAEYDAGAVAPDFPMEHMLLMLLPDATQQEVLNELVDGQYSPESPYYHQWLTPEQYGERFGVSDSDAAQIVAWLRSHDMQVEELTAGHRSIIFSGTAAQVSRPRSTLRFIYIRLAKKFTTPT